jgi:hypothetical protein
MISQPKKTTRKAHFFAKNLGYKPLVMTVPVAVTMRVVC